MDFNESSCRTETFLLCLFVLKSDQNLCILTSYNSLDLLFSQVPVCLALFTFLAIFHWRAQQAGKVFQYLYIFLVTFCSFHSDSNASSLPHVEFFNLFRKSFITPPLVLFASLILWKCKYVFDRAGAISFKLRAKY